MAEVNPKSEFEQIKKELEKLDTRLIAQEHRPLKILQNWRKIINKKASKQEQQAIYSSTISWWLSTRKTMIMVSLVGGLTSLASLIVAFQVWKAAETQNELVDAQNEKIQMQSHLMEAERRNTMILMLDNAMEELDEELQSNAKPVRANNGTQFLYEKKDLVDEAQQPRISNKLEARFVALSQSLRPYRVLEEDSLSEEEVSYERGMLFNLLFSTPYLSEYNRYRLCTSVNFDHMILDGGSYSYLGYQDMSSPLHSLVLKAKKARFVDVEFASGNYTFQGSGLHFDNAAFSNDTIIFGGDSVSLRKSVLYDATVFVHGDGFISSHTRFGSRYTSKGSRKTNGKTTNLKYLENYLPMNTSLHFRGSFRDTFRLQDSFISKSLITYDVGQLLFESCNLQGVVFQWHNRYKVATKLRFKNLDSEDNPGSINLVTIPICRDCLIDFCYAQEGILEPFISENDSIQAPKIRIQNSIVSIEFAELFQRTFPFYSKGFSFEPILMTDTCAIYQKWRDITKDSMRKWVYVTELN